MFEVVFLLCVNAAGEQVCRDQLVPGYEAETRAGCLAKLKANPAAEGARCVSAGEVLDLKEVAPGVFVHRGEIAEPDLVNRGDVTNLGFVIGEDAVAVIDTGTARWMGEALWRSIRQHTNKPVRHVILTHMHPDHVLGANVFAEVGAQIWGHAKITRALADRRQNYLESLDRLIGSAAFLGTDIPAVDVGISETAEIDLGGRVLNLRAWPVAHTGTDVTVFDGNSGTLFAGDLVFHRHLPALDGKLTGWQAVIEEMATMDVVRVVPGHGGPTLDWPVGVSDMRRYLNTLEQDTRQALAAGQRLGEAMNTIAASEAPKWELFEAFNPRNATVAYTELEWE